MSNDGEMPSEQGMYLLHALRAGRFRFQVQDTAEILSQALEQKTRRPRSRKPRPVDCTVRYVLRTDTVSTV